jgi:uncharacterized Zn finger protein
MMGDMKCDKCSSPMEEVFREHIVADVDLDSLSEGQLADYLASGLSGNCGSWAVTEATYKCTKCGQELTVQYG